MYKPDTLPFLGTIDVAVIGGGPAGAACALALRTCTAHVQSVALLEASTYEGARIGENVSSALLPLLEYLEVKERFLADGAHVESVAVQACWGNTMPRQLHSLRHWSGAGFLLHRGAFDAMLADTVHERGGKVYLSCRPEKISPHKDGWMLQIRHTSGKRFTLHARFLVDASGRKASIAKRLGALSTSHDSLIGVSRFFEMDGVQPYARDILIESTQDGWWYSAPLPQNRFVMSFMTDASVWRAAPGQNMEKWQAFLHHALHSSARLRQRAIAASADVIIRPAHSHVLDEVAGDGWLAVGDAAASFDPLSSLGIGFAIHSACHAALAIADYLAHGDKSRLYTYSQGVKEQFAQYFPTWRTYYTYETRWHDTPFWQIRQKK